MKSKNIVCYLISSSIFLSHFAQAQQTAVTVINSPSIQNVLFSKSILKAGSTVFETVDLVRFYTERNFEPVWIRESQKTEFVDVYKMMVTDLSLKHGLLVTDYLNSELEAYLNGLNTENAIAVELLMTNLYLKFAAHLSDGRVDPTTIDNDIRFKKRIFTDYKVLAQAVSLAPAMLSPIVETLAPQHLYYKNTLDILAGLNQSQLAGGYKLIKNPKTLIKLNSKHSVVSVLRERMNQQGYTLTGTGNIYDLELSSAVQELQKENGYSVSKDLLADSGIWNLLAVPVDVRILQAQATLEKLRWLPKKLEPNMVFVNTNATEMKVYENDEVIKTMATINGRAIRRTPMMQTWLTHVVLNTTWTATDSVIIQDKLPEIQKDVNYLSKVRMRLIDKASGLVVDPATLDWKNNSRVIAKRHTFVMDPGPKNALGVYKFPMSSDPNTYGSNPDDIFMHFTDDPSLFSKPNRHLSSGCVRLSEAKWFAEYLLKNNPQYTPEYIKSVVSKGTPNEIFQTNINVKLPVEEFRAVYTVPLTVEKTVSGKPRFMKDVYLQDRRITAAILSVSNRTDQLGKNLSVMTANSGRLTIFGTAGPTQYTSQVLVQKCDKPNPTQNPRTSMRKIIRKCSAPIRLALNKPQDLENGSYIVGFENTIYPGFVHIRSGQSVEIQLQKIAVPASLSKEKNIKAYRDLGSLTEQKKIYFQNYYSGQNLFRQTIRSYGDFSVAGLGEPDLSSNASYNYCSENNLNNLVLAKDIREHALFVCESVNSAQSMMDMADVYRFHSGGTYQEAVVDYPGDIMPKRYLRLLVSAPLKGTEFISVMPGHYKFISESGRVSNRINAMSVSESYPQEQRVFAKSRFSKQDTANEISEVDVAASTLSTEPTPIDARAVEHVPMIPASISAIERCQSATLWRTDLRSYCTADDQEGCSRSQAILCDEIKLDLRFKK